MSRSGRDRSGLTAVLLGDLEWAVEARARDVHRSVKARADGTVCSCGLVMPTGLDVATARGHRDLRWLGPVSGAMVIALGEGSAAPPRFEVVCTECDWTVASGSVRRAQRRRKQHGCGGSAGKSLDQP